MTYHTQILLEYMLTLAAGIAILYFIPKDDRQDVIGTALVVSGSMLFITIDLWCNFDLSELGYQYACQIPLIAEYNLVFSLGIDGISLVLLALTVFIMPLCIISASSVETDTKKFIIYLLLIELFLIISFITTNLFFFYIFFESVLIPMFILIGVWGARERKINAAYYFFLFTLFGSFFLLFGMLYLYTIAESTEYVVLSNLVLSGDEQKILWLCFFMPFAIKVPMFPFHIWLPEAHVEAPTIGSVILASLLLKLGGYGFIRFTLPLFPLGTYYFGHVVYLFALLSILYASLTTIRQSDLKKIIAYSSIAHMNLIVLGLFSGSFQGIDGAIYLMIGHGVVSAALFFCVGVLYDRYHTRAIKHYSGLVQAMPLFAIAFFLFTLGNMGFPGTSNFIGEFLIMVGIFSKNMFLLVLATSTIVLGAAYSVWLYNRVAFGTGKITEYSDLNNVELLILGILIFTMIILGGQTENVTDITTVAIKKVIHLAQFKK